MAKRLTVPATAYLRTSPVLPAGEVYAALSISRGRAWQMRERNDFPRCEGGKIDTAALANWLARFGCRVTWI